MESIKEYKKVKRKTIPYDYESSFELDIECGNVISSLTLINMMFLDKEESKKSQVPFCVRTRNLDFMHDYPIISLADNKVAIQS
jgi:hypothetical protein